MCSTKCKVFIRAYKRFGILLFSNCLLNISTFKKQFNKRDKHTLNSLLTSSPFLKRIITVFISKFSERGRTISDCSENDLALAYLQFSSLILKLPFEYSFIFPFER